MLPQLRRAFGVALFLCLGAHVAPAAADEADWLYFPMYERDTAHAVDIKALHFRADGLLESGSRYPMCCGEEGWPAEVAGQGSREYVTRLIDCSTGFYIDTGTRLLDEDGKTIATRSYEREEWQKHFLDRLERGRSEAWPDNSEIMLACAAAASPTLKARRAQFARKARPLVTYAPVTQGLADDSRVLRALAQMRFDVDAVRKRSPRSALAVFDQLRLQHASWRKAIAGPVPATEADLSDARRAQVQAGLTATLRKARGEDRLGPGRTRDDPIRLLPDYVIEFDRGGYWVIDPPESVLDAKAQRQVEDAVTVTQRMRADCRSGLEVPIAWNWRDADFRVLLTRPVPAALVLEELGRNRGTQAWDLRFGAFKGSDDLAQTCMLVIRQATGQGGDIDGLGRLVFDDMPNPIDSLVADPASLPPTPEAALLKLRAAWRHFYP